MVFNITFCIFIPLKQEYVTQTSKNRTKGNKAGNMTQNQEKPVTVLDKPEFLHAFDMIYLIAFIKRELKKNHLQTTSLLEKSG